jgi:glucoamylase
VSDGTNLPGWIDTQARFAAGAMLRAVSATHLVMERPGFGQRIVPRAGSVLASPVCAHYDPEPDYFFHWFRDAALVIDALRVAFAQGYLGAEALGRLGEFVDFSLALRSLDGQALLRENWQTHVLPDFRKYLRPQAELAALKGDAVALDARVNVDGTLDLSRWGRPQSDGPALRCLTLLRWLRDSPAPPESLLRGIAELLAADLAIAQSTAATPSVDIWEEESGYHYYTLLVHMEALSQGAVWLADRAAPERAEDCRAAAQTLAPRLAALWDPAGYYRSRTAVSGGDVRKELDMAVVLASLHAGRASGTHSVLDPQVQATLTALEALFESEYRINHGRPRGQGIAMGRYADDRYYSGGAYYFCTLAAAEFYFRLAAALALGAPLAASAANERFRQQLQAGTGQTGGRGSAQLALERGDSFMRTVQTFTPANGELSEQFDRSSGAQTSARQLSWSYAAFVTAAASRTLACQAIRARVP